MQNVKFSDLGPLALSNRLWVMRELYKNDVSKKCEFLYPSHQLCLLVLSVDYRILKSKLVYPHIPPDIRLLANEAPVCHYLIKEDCIHVWETCPGGIIGCHYVQGAFA